MGKRSNKGSLRKSLLDIYRILYREFGPQHWWPGETPFEVIVGAILTQNTSWSNVAKAIDNLKKEGHLLPDALHSLPLPRLARLIRPSGYYNIKTKRLKGFLNFLFNEYNGSLEKMFKANLSELREKLLKVNGIGPETADSILLYAGNYPIFVIDAYTKRILSRHNIITDGMDYHSLQRLFMDNLPEHADLFNEYHALIVKTAKDFCRKKPRCDVCPLNNPNIPTSSEGK
ncbi:MAG: endonuclease III domain-containing protein [Nitrospirae bacterium]|nr:endonuclease III domain-containing protein [Nitrospirota bacterium]